MEEKLRILEEEFKADLSQSKTQEELDALKVKYLGRKSKLNDLFSLIPALSREEKSIFGKNLNILKNKISQKLDQSSNSEERQEELIDLTYPAKPMANGYQHILSHVTEQICSVFEGLGFSVVEGGEIEDEWHNFSALNIPAEHPSRDVFDTFYMELKEKDKGKYLLRSHTSPTQIRVMSSLTPPVAVISPGRVYRPDEVDATHSFMFNQVEGFAVDEDINFSHLKGALLHFARSFFASSVNLRFRPHFFPFTEPSAEVDVSCVICGGKKNNSVNQRCSVCKGKGWVEVLGCGMIHPNVLEACGINSRKYKGFAFGMGIERLTMLKYGINDIRLFYDNDQRFLKQFQV
ncbi:MAG: phenylalanine--tRNA ligase subunit alpha [Candidatus Omnitrophica bacterium]|nr:phenylalanine--tRNA ligase subunit alpha [Candidatus Omnitrophota bacterium]